MQLLNSFLVTLTAGINTPFDQKFDYNQLGVELSPWRTEAKVGIDLNAMISSMIAKAEKEKAKQGHRRQFANMKRQMFARYHAARRN